MAMFVLTPIPVPVPALHPHPAQPHFRPPSESPSPSNPRERYMAAIAEARHAEMQYVAALAREEAGRRERQRQREEAQRQRRRWLRDEFVRRQMVASMGAFSTRDSVDGGYERRYEPAFVHAQPSFGAPWQQPAFYPEERGRGCRHDLHQRRENERGRRVRFEEPSGWQRPEHYREEWRDQERRLNRPREEQDMTPERFFNLIFGGGPARDGSAETAQVKATPPTQSPAQSSSSKAPVPALNSPHNHPAPPTERLPNQDVFEQELRDTLQAIMLSLFTPSDEAPLPKEAPKPTSESSSSATEGKGKGKAPVAAPAESASSKEPTSKDVAFSLETIRNVGASFEAIQSDFEFPRDLDFDRSSSILTSPDSNYKLAYTSRNAPVRYFEHAMSALLTQLDAVDSFGNEEVRVERRVVVSKIERALAEVEREVEDKLGKFKWKAGLSQTENAKPVEVVADNVSAGDAADLKPESSEPDIDAGLPSIVPPAADAASGTRSGDVEEAADISESGHDAPQPVVEIVASVAAAAAPETVVAALEVDINTHERDAPRSSGPDQTELKEIENSICPSSSTLGLMSDVDPDVSQSLPPVSPASPTSPPSSISSQSDDVDTAPSHATDVPRDDELVVVDNLSDHDGEAWSDVEA